jgi:hypothetical protein
MNPFVLNTTNNGAVHCSPFGEAPQTDVPTDEFQVQVGSLSILTSYEVVGSQLDAACLNAKVLVCPPTNAPSLQPATHVAEKFISTMGSASSDRHIIPHICMLY